jgi:hypothetical protein
MNLNLTCSSDTAELRHTYPLKTRHYKLRKKCMGTLGHTMRQATWSIQTSAEEQCATHPHEAERKRGRQNLSFRSATDLCKPRVHVCALVAMIAAKTATRHKANAARSAAPMGQNHRQSTRCLVSLKTEVAETESCRTHEKICGPFLTLESETLPESTLQAVHKRSATLSSRLRRLRRHHNHRRSRLSRAFRTGKTHRTDNSNLKRRECEGREGVPRERNDNIGSYALLRIIWLLPEAKVPTNHPHKLDGMNTTKVWCVAGSTKVSDHDLRLGRESWRPPLPRIPDRLARSGWVVHQAIQGLVAIDEL